MITVTSVTTIGLPCVPKIPDMSGSQVFCPEIIWLSKFAQMLENTFMWDNTSLVYTAARGINFQFRMARYKIKLEHIAL